MSQPSYAATDTAASGELDQIDKRINELISAVTNLGGLAATVRSRVLGINDSMSPPKAGPSVPTPVRASVPQINCDIDRLAGALDELRITIQHLNNL